MNSNEFSADKKEAIQRFRERVQDVLDPNKDNDVYLSKWLIARNFDLDKAEAMLRKHIWFMKVNGLDQMEDYIPPKVTDYFLTKRLGYDKDGSVVRYLHVGASDLKGLTLSLSKRDSFKFATYIITQDAKTQERERENDATCQKQVYIFDLKGLNWKSVIHRTVVERAFSLMKSYEKNHPENLKIVYVVNAPSFFNFIYNWVKTFVPESIINKVQVLSPEEIKDVITKNIDPSILPASLGGTIMDENGDPNCPSMFKVPLYATVPQEMLLQNQLNTLEKDPLAKKIVVDTGCVFEVESVVSIPNSTLQWDFQTVQYDISLGLNFTDQNSVKKDIIPSHRVDSHLFPESGSFMCQEPGIYTLVFDNTYSWFTMKEITYKVIVLPPYENTMD